LLIDPHDLSDVQFRKMQQYAKLLAPYHDDPLQSGSRGAAILLKWFHAIFKTTQVIRGSSPSSSRYPHSSALQKSIGPLSGMHAAQARERKRRQAHDVWDQKWSERRESLLATESRMVEQHEAMAEEIRRLRAANERYRNTFEMLLDHVDHLERIVADLVPGSNIGQTSHNNMRPL
jgi:hypothetical protein